MKKGDFNWFNAIFAFSLTFFICLFGLYYGVVSIKYLPFKIINDNIEVLSIVLLFTFIVLFLIFSLFYLRKKHLLYKLTFIIILLIFLFFLTYYYLSANKLLNKFNSINDFRNYVSSFGNGSILIYVLLQFLQVIILPIPSVVSTGAGVLLFGPLKGAIFSIIGIVLGSFTAFLIGRVFGYKAVKWLVGDKALSKAIKSVSNVDKILLAFMFLFPFFPDDLLCFVSGLSTITPLFFVLMVLITRSVAITFSCFSLNNNLIPFDTWWGILL